MTGSVRPCVVVSLFFCGDAASPLPRCPLAGGTPPGACGKELARVGEERE
jgi:hypothetical protein